MARRQRQFDPDEFLDQQFFNDRPVRPRHGQQEIHLDQPNFYNGRRMEPGVKYWGTDNIYRRDNKGKFISTNIAKRPRVRRVLDISDLTYQLKRLLRKINQINELR